MAINVLPGGDDPRPPAATPRHGPTLTPVAGEKGPDPFPTKA